ncbi:MAG: phosphatidate cytidylyltransferase [Planctomycetales bacterium]|nr:phosphatidate cytidylyltransferase [Planctomycetales bacterium]
MSALSRGLRIRLLLGTALMAAVAGALLADGLLGTSLAFTAVVLLGALAGCAEFYALSRRTGLAPWSRLGTFLALAMVAAEGLRASPRPLGLPGIPGAPAALFAGLLGLLALWLARGRGPEDLADIGATLLGALYVGGLASFLLSTRGLRFGGAAGDPGLQALVWTGLTAKSADIFAYFAGRSLGRRPLAPLLSPKKTIEGAAGGLLGSLAVGLALLPAAPAVREALGLAGALAVAAALSVACQVGDLVESRLKRRAGVKDSGVLFPEFGGVLDVVDGLIFSAPVGYACLRMAGG